MAQFKFGDLREKALARWIIDEGGNVIGTDENPLVTSACESDTSFTYDTESGALATIDVGHYVLHQGQVFIASYKTPDGAPLADDAALDFGIEIGTRHTHIVGIAACGGEAELLFYEGTEFTPGVMLAVFNRNRASDKTTDVRVWHTPAVTDVGTLLEQQFMPGGTGPRAIGGQGSQERGWALRPNENYLFRLINRSGASNPAGLVLEWCYQH